MTAEGGGGSTVVACIDVGNSTTEVLLARTHGKGVEVIGVGRSPTRRAKGSPESLAGAVALVRRLERQYGVRASRAVAAPLRPVVTTRASLPEDVPDTGRLALAAVGSTTAGGRGFGFGPPVLLDDVPADGEPVVVVVPAGTGYEEAVARLSPLMEAGRVAAVLVEDDEAVLLANRLPGRRAGRGRGRSRGGAGGGPGPRRGRRRRPTAPRADRPAQAARRTAAL